MALENPKNTLAHRAVRLAGIQPGYMPWLGYFDQMRRVDIFVVADEMPYSSSGWAHRNRVLGPRGPHWLTLPARPRRGQRICEVELDTRVPWRRRHLRTLHHFYGRSPHARDLLSGLESILDQNAGRLVDVSIPCIRFLAARLGITTPIIVSSEIGLEARYAASSSARQGPTGRIVAYMQALGATELLEGESGAAYLDLELFRAQSLRVEFHRYVHPVYPQLRNGSFVSHLSALDLLLSVGAERAREVLAAGRSE